MRRRACVVPAAAAWPAPRPGLNGGRLWQSSRTDIYYGITDSAVGIYGPALRLADGTKIIVGGWGGGKGQYKQLNDTYHLHVIINDQDQNSGFTEIYLYVLRYRPA
jgi:hypothetical protein